MTTKDVEQLVQWQMRADLLQTERDLARQAWKDAMEKVARLKHGLETIREIAPHARTEAIARCADYFLKEME